MNRRRWALLLLLGTISVLLLPVMEVEAVDDDGPLYAERIFGALATALRTSNWAPALVALGLTTAFLHYWLDRAVFRLSDPRADPATKAAAAPQATPATAEHGLAEQRREPT